MKDFKLLFATVFLNFLFTLDSNSVIAASVLKHLVNYNQLNEQMMSYSTLNSSYNLPIFCCFNSVLSIFHSAACPIFFVSFWLLVSFKTSFSIYFLPCLFSTLFSFSVVLIGSFHLLIAWNIGFL